MIVEDEARLRNSLANNIPWEENGIELVGLAANGEEALLLFDRKKPDVLLLDIQMPEMDGLTLARTILQKDPYIKCIVLSGHDNFAFAQSALELGICKYLLKPAGDTEILDAVLHAVELIRGEMEARHNQLQLQHKWSQHLPHIQEMFLQNWLYGKYVDWEIVEKSKDVQIHLAEEERYAVAVVEMDPLPETNARFNAQDAPLLNFSLKSISKEFLERHTAWVCSDASDSTVLLFSFPADQSEQEITLHLNTLIGKLLFIVKECLKVTASAGISSTTTHKEAVAKLYRQARTALQERIVYGHDLVIPYREEGDRKASMAVEPTLEKELEIALETGDEQRVTEALRHIWQRGLEQAGSLEEIREHKLYISSLFVRLIHQQGWAVQEVAGDAGDYFYEPHLLVAKEQINQWMHRVAQSYLAYQQKQRKTTSHKLVREILQLVEREMDQELSLHMVADRMFVNSSYLSRLFKQEMGQSFSSYVLERKMESAKRHLLDGAKVYDAARIAGYRDVSYFTRVFRKYWGVTPGEIKGSSLV